MEIEDSDRLNEYVLEVQKELAEKSLLNGSYCMLVCVGKMPKFCYKSLSHFKERVLLDIANVDPMHTVEFACMIFES